MKSVKQMHKDGTLDAYLTKRYAVEVRATNALLS